MAEEKYIPTKEEFINEFNRFNKGNPNETYSLIRFSIMSYKTFMGDPVTWDLIKIKWNQYLQKCKEEETNVKYVKSMSSFLKSKDWDIDFAPKGKFDKKNELLDRYTGGN